MRFIVHVEGADGEFTASCPELDVQAHGVSAESALQALRRNLRFHIELCPCSTIEEEWIEFDLR